MHPTTLLLILASITSLALAYPVSNPEADTVDVFSGCIDYIYDHDAVLSWGLGNLSPAEEKVKRVANICAVFDGGCG